jgi:exonuclease III
MTLQGLVWNCRGLKKGVSTFLKNLIYQYQFDFIGLHETMIVDCDVSLLRKFDAHHNYLWEWTPSKGRSRGILVGINLNRFDVGSFKKGDFILQINLWDKVQQIKWNLLVVYGAAQEEHKFEFLSELSRFCDSSFEPHLIGGDFNIIRYAKENSSNRGVHKHTGIFNSIIHFFQLRELIMRRY